MQSRQDTPTIKQVRTILILLGIIGLLILLMFSVQIFFPHSFPPFPRSLDMAHLIARIAFVILLGLVWLFGLGYFMRLIVHSRRARAAGIAMEFPGWITSFRLTPLHAIALLVGYSCIKTFYQLCFGNEPFTILLPLNGMILPIIFVICYMSLQSIKAHPAEQTLIQDPYAGLAAAGYILGVISCLFVGWIYLFSPPFAFVGIILSVLGRPSSTYRIRANWGLGLSAVGILAPIIVIIISMLISKCYGWPAWNCSIPVAIDELLH